MIEKNCLKQECRKLLSEFWHLSKLLGLGIFFELMVLWINCYVVVKWTVV